MHARFHAFSALVLTSAAYLASVPAFAQAEGKAALVRMATPATPAKQLFGKIHAPSPGAAEPIGFYSRGCLAGGQELPITGSTWQVMRLSRNRNWGTPALISFIERVSSKAAQASGWPGLMIGDMSQPRGGPMITGHASHQIGLDVDMWFDPMPNHVLTREQRETMGAQNMVAANRLSIDSRTWTPARMEVLKAVAKDAAVDRIFVNAAIKKAVCEQATGDRAWLNKVHAYFGHKTHFHVRLYCPRGAASCTHQEPFGTGEGCGASLAHWFSDAVLHPKPNPNYKPKPPLVMSQLPAPCRGVLAAH